MMRQSALALGILLIGGVILPSGAHAGPRQYEVTVTNITRGESFTPSLVATHRDGVRLFASGAAASPELASLAEGGDTAPLAGLLEASGDVAAVATSEGLLTPGQSVTIPIETRGKARQLSLAAMLIPTNDAFVGVTGVELPRRRGSTASYTAPAYDAGSEPNDEDCANIPGPACGGEGGSPGASGEGYVHVHAGIHGIADLPSATYDWRNPVARISIRRTR
jgi:hypothetical protein